MRFLDLPPLWLLAALIVMWVVPVSLPGGTAVGAGVLCLVAAAALTLAALREFRRAKTTVIPHLAPSALITSGIFRWTRNPIYLADVLILAGLTLIWGSLPGLILTPALAVLLDRRFIRPEEERLRTAFGPAFDRYAATTRRWL
ncbi:MAG: methyltransferase family protein [Paracoccaceae bacterium]